MLIKSCINPKIDILFETMIICRKQTKINHEVYFSTTPILKDKIKQINYKKNKELETKKNISGSMGKTVKPLNRVTCVNMSNSQTTSWTSLELITHYLFIYFKYFLLNYMIIKIDSNKVKHQPTTHISFEIRM
jgi:hypothetical protein